MKMNNDQLKQQLEQYFHSMKTKCGEHHPLVKSCELLRSMGIRLVDLRREYDNCVDLEKHSKLYVKLNKLVDEMNSLIQKVEGMTQKEEFIDYVYQFYGPGGLYSLNANKEQINIATDILMSQYDEINFDSLDRERVRDILIDKFGLK